jgi:regulation of enolase protein 1 (concanavalin A-like superfamily)
MSCAPRFIYFLKRNKSQRGGANLRHLSYISLLFVFTVILITISSACGQKETPPGGQVQPAQPSVSTPGSGQPSPAPAATTASVSKPGGMPDIADMKSLPSYRFSIMNKMAEGAGAGSFSIIKYEWVRDQKAEHTWMEDANGKITEVSITIGDKRWIWMGVLGGWIEQPPQTTPSASLPSDLASQLQQAQQDVEHSKARFDKKGTETVNNVRCIRYTFEYNLTTEMPYLPTGGTRKIEMHSTGETWIADQSGLPAVMIRSKGKSEVTFEGKKTVTETEQNLTDIGAAITINPPAGAKQMPSAPTPPGGTTPPTPKPGATTPSAPTPTQPPAQTPTESAGVFTDDFKSAWDAKWVWTDPNHDAQYNLTGHTGFLRLTAPDGNDLASFTNYDAPRLLRPHSGNFLVETLVEFDPRDNYQGAGLLVWQDQDNFLRFEFGYGGIGSDAKNVSFLKQEAGTMELVKTTYNLPANIIRVELQLQRNGSRFTAWWREPGAAWQQVGETDLNLQPQTQVGNALVVDQGASQISADFDYVKITTK